MLPSTACKFLHVACVLLSLHAEWSHCLQNDLAFARCLRIALLSLHAEWSNCLQNDLTACVLKSPCSDLYPVFLCFELHGHSPYVYGVDLSSYYFITLSRMPTSPVRTWRRFFFYSYFVALSHMVTHPCKHDAYLGWTRTVYMHGVYYSIFGRKSPNIQSYTVYICSSGQLYVDLFFLLLFYVELHAHPLVWTWPKLLFSAVILYVKPRCHLPVRTCPSKLSPKPASLSPPWLIWRATCLRGQCGWRSQYLWIPCVCLLWLIYVLHAWGGSVGGGVNTSDYHVSIYFGCSDALHAWGGSVGGGGNTFEYHVSVYFGWSACYMLKGAIFSWKNNYRICIVYTRTPIQPQAHLLIFIVASAKDWSRLHCHTL